MVLTTAYYLQIETDCIYVYFKQQYVLVSGQNFLGPFMR